MYKSGQGNFIKGSVRKVFLSFCLSFSNTSVTCDPGLVRLLHSTEFF